VRIKADILYGARLVAEISDKSPLRLVSVGALADMAKSQLGPVLKTALAAAAKQLAIFGVTVEFSDVKLDVKALD